MSKDKKREEKKKKKKKRRSTYDDFELTAWVVKAW